MLVGLKYCGGCNPRYDRGALVRQIQAALPEVEFQPVRPGQSYDLLLVVSGCRVECADTEGIHYRLARLSIYDASQMEELIQSLRSYL